MNIYHKSQKESETSHNMASFNSNASKAINKRSAK